MKPGEPIMTSLEAIRTLRRSKFNPLRNLKPERLVSILESWEIGHLRDGALLFETISDRDDTIKSVKPKREKEVSQLDKQVVALPGTGDAGDRHREILEDFWMNVRATNSYDRNERGGFRRLVKQMMTATSFRYAAHHIVWHPSRGRLRATFEFVPLWLFENLTGTLRYLKDPWSTEGELLDPTEWMVTYGDGLMIACSIGYLAKRSAFNDWLIFSEKFSVPGVLGRTSSKRDSDEGRAMRAAVESFGHDWTGVIYGDDGTHEKPIDIIQASGNPTGMPMPAVVERVDRKFAALYRGADLSSMSSGPSGEGSGASLQGKEKDILLADDAETINETLAEVSRMVIEWYDGRGAEVLAKVELIVPSDEDEKFYLESVNSLAKLGVRVSKDAVLERLGVQEAADDEVALGETQDFKMQDPRQEIANAMDPVALSEWIFEVRSALTTDLQPLGKALAAAMQTGDLPAMQAALKKISDGMPDLAGEAESLAEVLSRQFAKALTDDEPES
jgi:phage gp29-like protein